MDFRNATEKMLRENREVFLKSMYDINFDRIENYHRFVAAVYQVFRFLNISGEQRKILEHWINRPDLNSVAADFLLFYIVRDYLSYDIGQMWLAKCIEFAEHENNISLTESLLLSLKEKAKDNARLIKLASELSSHSNKIKNLLTKYSLAT